MGEFRFSPAWSSGMPDGTSRRRQALRLAASPVPGGGLIRDFHQIGGFGRRVAFRLPGRLACGQWPERCDGRLFVGKVCPTTRAIGVGGDHPSGEHAALYQKPGTGSTEHALATRVSRPQAGVSFPGRYQRTLANCAGKTCCSSWITLSTCSPCCRLGNGCQIRGVRAVV
jgi:hypothetical protein